MNTIRTDNASIGGVWAGGVSAVFAPQAGNRAAAQAFGDFSAFAGNDARIGLNGSLDADGAARGVSDRLTEARDNGFG